MLNKYLISIIIIISLFSCEELVNPNLITIDPLLVVDGYIGLDTSYIKLTETTAFTSEDAPPHVSSATVRLIEGENRIISFKETTSGVYTPIDKDFQPKLWQRYQLQVENSDNLYYALGEMVLMPEIDTMTIKYVEANSSILQEKGYYVSVKFEDNSHIRNYYKFDIFKGTLKINSIPEVGILIESDIDKDGKYLSYEIPYPFELGDSVTVIMKGITKTTYEYYQGLKALTDVGSPSQSVPKNPISNIYTQEEGKKGLGLFSVENSQIQSIIIEEEEEIIEEE